eukprot:c20763_g6_i2.p1 GENE.c20763_g6_i2~~c20763_g6_i2.p1  ORF type:complete len:914 (-),score=206.49 c20763_g6_i2:127-2814(-)
MDRTTNSTDAYVEIKFQSTFKTSIQKGTLNPKWNEPFMFQLNDDIELQDEQLLLRVMDNDLMTPDDPIGSVHIDIGLLLQHDQREKRMRGWFPIYHTRRGVRGYLECEVELTLISVLNRFTESSAGVIHFGLPMCPPGFTLVRICGFVEELVTAEDPDYQGGRSLFFFHSTKNRQDLLYSVSAKLKRAIGRQALNRGGNAVVGMSVHFDVEEDSGLVCRGYGTACVVRATSETADTPLSSFAAIRSAHVSSPPVNQREGAIQITSPKVGSVTQTPSGFVLKAPDSPPLISLDDNPTMLPVNSPPPANPALRFRTHQDSVTRGKVDLLTLKSFPKHIAVQLGMVVVARSVKRLPERQDVRRKMIAQMHDAWWEELREEAMQHCQSLGCAYVAGYSETCTLNANEDICILSAVGTAVNLTVGHEPACASCHLPQASASVPSVAVHSCSFCGQPVPEIILSTIEPPNNTVCVGPSHVIEARVTKSKKHERMDEANAQLVSDMLPFLEYDVHRQLMLRLRVGQYNAAFGVTFQISISDDRVIVMATATALNLKALPQVTPLNLNNTLGLGREGWDTSAIQTVQNIIDQQVRVMEDAEEGQMAIPNLKDPWVNNSNLSASSTEHADSDEEPAPPKLALVEGVESEWTENTTRGDEFGASFTFNSAEDIASLSLIAMDSTPPPGVTMSNLFSVPEALEQAPCALSLVTLIQRLPLKSAVDDDPNQPLPSHALAQLFRNLYTTLFFRLRRLTPYALSRLRVLIDDCEDTLQCVVTAAVLAVPPLHHPLPDYHGTVVLTPMCTIPGAVLVKPLGLVHLHLVREANEIESDDPMASFCQILMHEAQALLRSKVSAMGGNAALGFSMSLDQLGQEDERLYALISMSGDAYVVQYKEGSSPSPDEA